MTPKQEKFCLAYLETGNASEAYRLAYNTARMKPATINRKATGLLAKGTIRARLKELRDALADKVLYDRTFVIEGLIANYQRAMQAEAVTDREGVPTGEYVYQGTVANRALELLGKELGMFISKHELTGAGGSPLLSPAWVQVQTALLGVLEAYPEARQAVGKVLASMGEGDGHGG